MAEQNITDYFIYIKAVFKRATKIWQDGEGRIEVIVTDDKGKVEGAIKGGETWRSAKAKDEDEE